MNEWSLEKLYKGYDDPMFQKDIVKFDEISQKFIQFVQTINHEDEKETLKQILLLLEEQSLLQLKLGHYLNMRQTTDTSNPETASLMNQLEDKASRLSKSMSMINRYIADIEHLDQLFEEDALLKEYTYLLKETKADAKYQLGEEVEEVIAKMNLNAGSAWTNLREFLTSTLDVDYQGEQVTLSHIRNLAYDDDREVRKSAYEAELKAYDSIKEAVAFSLNSIKGQVNTICELRGYESPLAMTLHDSHMQKETLDAMMEAITQYMPKFRAYLKRKAVLLGYENGLPWYELFAPIKDTSSKFSIDDAKDYLIAQFQPFAQDLADMVKQAFDENWIDFYPRKGKVGGAFCENLPFLKESRILTNYNDTLGDVVTLAHELGHAYHGMMIQDHRILNTNYSMPVAETASTFNENIIMNAAIKDADGDEKIALIENQLQDLTQIICDIYARFQFERTVFEKRKTGFLFARELEEIMIDAQKEAYGDGLDPTYLHPYMWVNKSHYYAADLSYYNFPYAFGGLFARGLIVQYDKNGPSFVENYRKLLKATTISSVEDVAKMADIDITDKAFWQSSLETCVQRIDEFLELTKES